PSLAVRCQDGTVPEASARIGTVHLSNLQPATAEERETLFFYGSRLAPEELRHALAELPPFRRPPQLVVIPRDQGLCDLRVVLEHLVRREVREGLRRVAVDIDLVDAEQVVLPD